jgi:hypothetical protein
VWKLLEGQNPNYFKKHWEYILKEREHHQSEGLEGWIIKG